MRSTRARLAVCLAVALLCACRDWKGIKGSGSVKTETREAAEFNAVSFKAEGDVEIKQTGKESLSVTAEDNLLPLLETRVKDGTLEIDTADGVHIHPTKTIKYAIQVKKLDSLHISGVGSVEAADIKGKSLSVSFSGIGSVKVSGSADDLELHISGVGSYDGEGFKTKRAEVHSSGVGNAVVNASDELTAHLSGVGSVEYVGTPRIDQHVSGVGAVKKR